MQPAFFVAVIASKENKDVQLNVAHCVKQQNEATIGSLGCKEANLMDVILKFIDQPNDLINRCCPCHFHIPCRFNCILICISFICLRGMIEFL